MKKLLYTRESPQLQPIRSLIEKQKHRTIVLWAIDCGYRILPLFEDKYPDDDRPRLAVEAARDWALGKINMPEARKAALESHKAATNIEEDHAACAAARAMGHVVGTVHVETHAIDVIMYGMTAFVYSGKKGDEIKKELRWMHDRLLYWKKNIDRAKRTWAQFLLRDGPNKEYLLRLMHK